MYKVCPKCGHERSDEASESAESCPACGLIYQKWLQRQLQDSRPVTRHDSSPETSSLNHLLDELLTPKQDNRVFLGGRVVAWLLLLWLGILMLTNNSYQDAIYSTQGRALNFLHGINLIFHEAGHVIFALLGDFMRVLGGSLLQVLVPLIVAWTFCFKQGDNFAASVGLWWAGQSLSDVSVYIRDAREMQLTLLGGGTGMDRPGFHDWHNLLSRLGWLQHERGIATMVDMLGLFLMGLSLLWGLLLIKRQWEHHA